MTPFDVTYAHEFLIEQSVALDLKIHAPVQPASQPAPPAIRASAPVPSQLPGFPLADSVAMRAALTVQARPQAQPASMLTPSYTEFLLQLLDKDSVMTGLVVIAAYVGILQAL